MARKMTPMTKPNESVAHEFAAEYEKVRAQLLQRMEERGLHARDGWRIHESIRQVNDGTEIVLRPVHLWLPAPDDLECTCWINEPGTAVSADCA
jgi:hypothetical protein